MGIERFRSKALKRFFVADDRRGIPATRVEKIRDILTALQEADEPSVVALFPGWRLHRLSGDLCSYWSITVTGNWRIVFRFEDGNVFDVDLIDYH